VESGSARRDSGGPRLLQPAACTVKSGLGVHGACCVLRRAGATGIGLLCGVTSRVVACRGEAKLLLRGSKH